MEELRKRLIYSFAGIGISFAVSYAYIKEIVEILMRPLVKTLPPGSSLVFTAVPEAFFTYFKAALMAGVFFSFPFILYHVWAFVSPGLYQREKKYILPYLFVSTFFFALGASFCYFIVFPTVLLLLSFNNYSDSFVYATDYLFCGRSSSSISRISSNWCCFSA